jgi:chorismate-pyruvate lyase
MLQTARVRRRVDRPRAGWTLRRQNSPLHVAYAQAGIAPPAIVAVAASDIPHPYHALLVHEGEMTRTLEEHVGGTVGIRVLSTRARARFYVRRVLLVDEASGRPVAMGAVRLTIGALPRPVRAEVIRGRVPLGRLLRAAGLDFMSRPTGYLSVTPNPEMMGLFWMTSPDTLFGRETNVLLGARKIGEIVEILPRV